MPTQILDRLIDRHPSLRAARSQIAAAYEMMRETLAADRTIYLCGNGGSAADAEHWAGEMLKGFKRKRPLPPEAKAALPSPLAEHLQGALRVVPLTGFLSLATAFANDVDPRLIFAQLTWGLGREADLLVGISTSGNAENVLLAVSAAKARKMKTIGLTGEPGGKLRDVADLAIHVPASETFEIQELHLPVYHCLCLMLEETFFER